MWSAQLADWLDELSIPRTEPSPWSSQCGQSTCDLAQRVKSMLDAVVWTKLGLKAKTMSWEEKRQALVHVYCDVSQNPLRKPHTNAKGIMGTMTTSSLFYSFSRDDFVLPFEMLLWHGHSRALTIPSSVKASSVKALAGEGMSLCCLGTALWSGLLMRFGKDGV